MQLVYDIKQITNCLVSNHAGNRVSQFYFKLAVKIEFSCKHAATCLLCLHCLVVIISYKII